MLGDCLSVILFTVTLALSLQWMHFAVRWHQHLERGSSEAWARKQPEFIVVCRLLPVIVVAYIAAIAVTFLL